MGVHWTRPRRMADAGRLTARVIAASGDVEFAVYSRQECEADWEEYEELILAGEGALGRPRTKVSDRHAVLRVLSSPKIPHIDFDDAIGVEEASRILRVFYTRIPRMVSEGKLIGRRLWSARGVPGRANWIISKRSAIELSKAISKQEAAGTKRGRRRQPAKK